MVGRHYISPIVPSPRTENQTKESRVQGQSNKTASLALQGQPRLVFPTRRGNPTDPKRIYNVNCKLRDRQWASLIDRGANGGIAGTDTRVMHRTGRTIDLSGIDNHTVNNLPIVVAGGVVRSNKGEIILVMNEYAHMPNGKSIHSCGQIEFFKAHVHDKSPTITGKAPCIMTLEGHVIPISIINGLPYIKMRPFTDSEKDKLPHIPVTSNQVWDPTVLDYTVKEEWYSTQKSTPSYFKDSVFDEYGEPTEELITPNVDEEEPNPNDDAGIPTEGESISQGEIQIHLHQTITEEIQREFIVFEVDGKLIDVNASKRRRSPRIAKLPTAIKPTVKSKSKAKPKATRKPSKGIEDDSTPKEDTEGKKYMARDILGTDKATTFDPDTRDQVNSSNNLAKDIERDNAKEGVLEVGPKVINTSRKKLEFYSKFFPGVPLPMLKRTFQATTQYGHIGAAPGMTLYKRLKAPNPALNVTRRNEPVATDTVYGPRGIRAVDNGSTAAQLFVGRKSHFQSIHPCGDSDAQFAKTLLDEIRRYGAMDVLISDRAKAEISIKIKEILRTMVIDDWQSEPHNKNQNYAERMWQVTQRMGNVILNQSGAPKKLWLLALKLAVFISNHTARESLGGRTPIEWLLGFAPDISVLLQFIFYEPVYYSAIEPKVGETPELLGRFVGISENVGHKMTYLVLTENDKVIPRSVLRTANKEGTFDNIRAKEAAPNRAPMEPRTEVLADAKAFSEDPKDSSDVIPETVEEDEENQETKVEDTPIEMFPDDPAEPEVTESKADIPDRIHTRSEQNEAKSMPTINVGSLIDRTFISDPDEDGEQLRAQVQNIEDTGKHTADGREALYEFKCKVGEKTFEEIMTYNQMLEWCNRDLDKDDMYKIQGIVGHKRDPNDRGKYLLLIHWDCGTQTWNNFATTFADDPVTVSMYAKKNGLLEIDGWKRCKRIVKNTKILARMANQTKLRSYRNKPVYHYGIQVPRDHKEAVWLDEKNGNTLWQDSEELELKQLDEYDTFIDKGLGTPVPEGYTLIPCHLVFACKHDGRRKGRFVAGGHRTGTPVDSTYSGVTSILGIRLITFLAEHNDLNLWSTDIGNAYLESFTQEKVCFYAGPEFGEREGHLMLINKALYGLKSSGKRWHDRLHDVLIDMGFTPSMAEEDIWMRDKGDHYEYIGVYVDDLMIASKEPEKIISALEMKPNNFKLKGTGPTTFHLGCDYFRDEDGTLCVGPRKYIDKMVIEYQRLYGSKPSTKASSPLEKNDHPELDTSDILDEDGIRQYQSLIGTLQWAITLGRFDISVAVMTMSGFRVAPREGHLERVKRICGYLYKYQSGCIRIRTNEPDYSSMSAEKYDWSRTVYGNVKEAKPNNAPKPLGKQVILTCYKDANLYHDFTSGKAVTGILHFINQTPIDWTARKQPTVETATYGSEFVAARIAIQQITALRLNLRYLGVPIKGQTWMFGDNESVVTSSTIPHSQLSKRHHALSYHYVREAVASDMVTFSHLPGEWNPSDVLSKHWGHAQVWQLLQPILFWKGNTADLLARESALEEKKGSVKFSIPPETESTP